MVAIDIDISDDLLFFIESECEKSKKSFDEMVEILLKISLDWFEEKKKVINTEEYGVVNSLRYTGKYVKWRDSVRERDGWKCVKCESTERIQAHHIYSFIKYPNLRFELANGLTLCAKCHRELHKKCIKEYKNN